jgi:phosphohistidine phosphatase
MLHLWVLRHAKAAAQGPDGDMSRPITARGRRQADAVREHIESLSGEASLPELVLCSLAVRARETAELVMAALPESDLEFDDALYSQDAAELVEWLGILDPEVSSLMIVGHNPTLHELCTLLASSPDSEAIESAGLPTAGLVELEQQNASSWGELEQGRSRLVHRFTPEKN